MSALYWKKMDVCMLRYKISYGYTLLEVMLSLVIMMAVVAFVLEGYLYYQKQFSWLRDQLELERKAERVISLMREQIHLAGFIGCAKLTKDFPLVGGHDNELSPDNKLEVTKQNHLTIRGMTDMAPLLNPAAKGTSFIETTAKNHWKEKRRMMITNCLYGEMIEIKNINRHSKILRIELTHPLQFSYAAGESVGELSIREFYVEQSSLFIKERYAMAREIIQDVTEMVFHLNKKGVSIDFKLALKTATRDWHLFSALM